MSGACQKVFVVYNPRAGREELVAGFRAALARHFAPPRWALEIYETTGREDVAAVCRAACRRGVSLVIAAGGDGTVVGVANGLLDAAVPLGILPLGTGNYLARALLIPGRMDEALDLLAGDHAVMSVDALKVGDRSYFSNVSVGISPRMVGGTRPAEKRIFGRLAYVLGVIKQWRIFQQHRYRVTIDGRTRLLRASEVLVSSTTLLKKPPFLFGPPQTLADGRVEVYVVTARTLVDYLRLAWDVLFRPGKPASNLWHWTARQGVRVEALRGHPLVQGDGEVIGHAPVAVSVVPNSLQVITPRPAPSTGGRTP